MIGDIAALVSDNLDIWTSVVERKSGTGRPRGGKVGFYGVERLRALILELAVNGRLVPQDADDRPAGEILRDIEARRTEFAKAGKVKKARSTFAPSINPPFEIPEGWQWVQISEIGHDWGQREPDSDFTYIDVGSIDPVQGVIRDPAILGAGEAPSRARRVVRPGSVIYSTIRPYLLNVAIVDQVFEPSPIASTAFAVIHPFQGIEARFIYHYLRSPPFIRYVEDCQSGIAYPAINDKQFYSGWIPIPPSAEQQRIVAKIDELMALCDTLETRSTSAIEAHQTLLETFLATLRASTEAADLAASWVRLQSSFDSLFTTEAGIEAFRQVTLDLALAGKLTGTLGNWPLRALGEFVVKATAGWSPKCAETPRSGDRWGVLKVSAVTWGRLQPDENKALPSSLPPRPDFEVKPGDFLISRANTIDLVARSVIAPPNTPPKLMMSDKIIRLTFNDEIDPSYVNLIHASAYARKYYARVAGGTSSSMKNVSQDQIRAFQIPVPPRSEQQRIVEKAREILALCDILKVRITDAAQTQKRVADAIVERAVA